MKIIILLSFLFTGLISGVEAATITAATSGNWNVGATWAGGIVPSATDDVVITDAVAGGVSVSVTTSVSCKSLLITNTTSGTNTLLITVIVNTGGFLTVNGTTTVQASTTNAAEFKIVSGGEAFTNDLYCFDANYAGDLTMTGTGKLHIKGFYTAYTATTNNITAAITSIIYFDGSGNQDIPFAAYPCIVTGGGGTKTFVGTTTTTIAGDLTINTPMANTSSSNLIVTGIFAISSTGSFSKTGTGSLQLNNTGNMNIAGPVNISGGTINNFKGDVVTSGLGTLTFSTTAAFTKSLTTAADVNLNTGSVISSSGAFIANSPSVFTLTAGTFTATDNFTLNGSSSLIQSAGTLSLAKAFVKAIGANTTFTAGTVNYNGTIAQTVIPAQYFNLTVSGDHTTNNVTFSTLDSIKVKGTFAHTATFTTGIPDFSGTNFVLNSAVSQTLPALVYNNLYFDGLGTFTLAGAIAPTGNVIIRQGSVVANGSTIAVGTPPATPTFPAYTITGVAGKTFEIKSGGTLRLGGSTTTSNTFPSGFGTYTLDKNSTVEYASANAQTADAQNFGNLTFSNTGARTISGICDIRGNFNSGTTNTYTVTGSTLNFIGTTDQSISGALGGTTTPINNLTVNKASGKLLLNAATTVNGTLALTSGAFDLNGLTLTVSNAAPATITRTNGYILSEKTDNTSLLTWNIGANIGMHIYPFGDATGNYIPVNMNVVSGNPNNISIATYHAPANVPLNGTALRQSEAQTVDRFWQISSSGANPTFSVDLGLTATTTEINGLSNLYSSRNSGVPTASWDSLAAASFTTNGNTVTRTAVIAFSPWTIYSRQVPLPVTLVSFNGKLQNNTAALTWKSASETNVNRYEVEKATNAGKFTKVGEVQAKNMSTTYNYASEMTEATAYFRLKMIDNDGTAEYSKVIALGQNQISDISIYPNPSTGSLTIKGYNAEYTAKVINNLGEVVLTKSNTQEALLSLESLPNGIYTISINSGNSVSYHKIALNN